VRLCVSEHDAEHFLPTVAATGPDSQSRITGAAPPGKKCSALFLMRSSRHTFAMNRLVSWYRQRKNVQRLLPHLSAYLGHCGLSSTRPSHGT